GLPREAVHQIQVEILESRGAGAAGSGNRGGAVVDAAQGLQVAVGKALNADGQAVDPGLAEAAKPVLLEGARVGLQGDFDVAGKAYAPLGVVEDGGDGAGGKQAGGAAADKDGGQPPALRQLQILVQVGHKGVHIGVLRQLVTPLMGVEITVGAFAHAPGNVDIEGQRGKLQHPGSELDPVGQGVEQQAHRPGAVAEGVFDLPGQLGGGAVLFADKEQGVVAKAVAAAGLFRYPPLPGALADQGGGVQVVAHQHQQALEAGAPLGLGNTGEHLQQLAIVVRICGLGAGKARRVDARGAVQIVHLQARVIGNGGQAGGLGGVAGLEEGILDKAEAGLLGLAEVEFGQRPDLQVAAHQEFPKLFQLALVGAGQDQGIHGQSL